MENVIRVDRFFEAQANVQALEKAKELAVAARHLLCVPEMGWHVVDVPGAAVWVSRVETRFVGDDFEVAVRADTGAVTIEGDRKAAHEFVLGSLAEPAGDRQASVA